MDLGIADSNVTILFVKDDLIFAGTNRMGVHPSEDDGRNWTALPRSSAGGTCFVLMRASAAGIVRRIALVK